MAMFVTCRNFCRASFSLMQPWTTSRSNSSPETRTHFSHCHSTSGSKPEREKLLQCTARIVNWCLINVLTLHKYGRRIAVDSNTEICCPEVFQYRMRPKANGDARKTMHNRSQHHPESSSTYLFCYKIRRNACFINPVLPQITVDFRAGVSVTIAYCWK